MNEALVEGELKHPSKTVLHCFLRSPAFQLLHQGIHPGWGFKRFSPWLSRSKLWDPLSSSSREGMESELTDKWLPLLAHFLIPVPQRILQTVFVSPTQQMRNRDFPSRCLRNRGSRWMVSPLDRNLNSQ